MKRAAPDFCWLGLGILVVLLVLAVSGPVMRERDQAALLEGAVEMARSGDYRDQGWYNFDKQYLTYWTLAGVFDAMGLGEPGADPDRVVLVGNRAAAMAFCGCLLLAMACAPRRGMATLPVLMAALLAPALLFSAPLLASNIFSAGCLLLLAVALRRRHAGWWNALLCTVLTAGAVAFRRDAALALPLLCLLSVTRFSVRGLLVERRHWLMGAGAIGAVVVGALLTEHGIYRPDMFFDPRLYGAYLVFGLSGAALLLGWLPIRLLTSRRNWVLRSATGMAMLLPLAFYSGFLYTPRHLFLSALVLVLGVLLPRGELWWQTLRRRRLDRFVICSGVAGSLVLWVVGVRLETLKSPEVVREEPTLYPTADGFWPMGSYQKFLVALARANDRPVDHNQEVWEAWKHLPTDHLPPGKARVHSAGLRAYGYLVLKLRGRGYVTGRERGDYDLVPDRSLGRMRPGFYRTDGEERDEIDWENVWLDPVGGTATRIIYLAASPEGRVPNLDAPWVAQLAVVKALGADDFHLEAGGSGLGFRVGRHRGHRIAVIFARPEEASGFQEALTEAGWKADRKSTDVQGVPAHLVSFVAREALPPIARERGRSAKWVTCSILPAFMSRSHYRGNGD